jgi:AraC-like DNA-binding protein
VFVQEGVLKVYHDGIVDELKSGEGIMIYPYRVHSFSHEGEINAKVLMFSLPTIERYGVAFFNTDKECEKIKIDEKLFDFCSYAVDRYKKTGDLFIIKSLFFAFVSDFEIKGGRDNKSTLMGNEAGRVMKYLYTNISEPLTLLQASKDLLMSAPTLEKIIGDYTGTTFKKFVHNVRIEKAMALLIGTEKSVSEIAYECGFGSLRTFSRVFFNVALCTPTEYRNNTKE